jgi:hypothetical protein
MYNCKRLSSELAMEESLVQPAPEVLEYCTRPARRATDAVRRFHVIYAVGIVLAYIVIQQCWNAWPHTSNSAEPRKAELAMAIQVTGGAACGWLALALRRINNIGAIRWSVLTWLLVAANAVVGLAVLPMGYQ